jgi:CubicO group peptidase (beta-lactamase class C family)
LQKKSLATLFVVATPLVAAACSLGSKSTETLRPITAPTEKAGTIAANVHVDRIGPVRALSRAKATQRAALTTHPATTPDPSIPPKYQAFAAAFESEMNSLGAPGASVALLEHGQLTFAHGFGVKGPNSEEPVDARTLFRYGSMNKALTATAMLQLVDEGKASLGQAIPSLIPNVGLTGANAERVTLKDLLSQQSELFDFTNYNINPQLSDFECPTGPASLNQFVTGSLFKSSEFSMGPPGSVWLYSNPNYVLAGAALETVTGAYYADAMKSRVFAPLGMTRTFFDPNEAIADGDYTDGLSTNPDGSPWDVAPNAYDCVWLRPAGLGFSSVLDYAKFVEFLAHGNTSVLSEERRMAMQSPIEQTYTYGANDSYGYGLVVKGGQRVIPDGFYHSKEVFHDGGIPGFATEFYFFPETGFGFVAFANADNAYFYTSLLTALESFSGLTASPTTPPNLDFDAGTFPGYAGTYEDESGIFGKIVVTDEGGAFDVDLPSLDAAGITYEASMSDDCEYGFYVTVDNVPASQQSTLLGALAGGGLSLSFIPGPSGTFDWVDVDGALAARRIAVR